MITEKNLTQPNWIKFSQYRMFILYKLQFASKHNANAEGIKYCYSYDDNHEKELSGLIERIVVNQKGDYRIIELFDNKKGDYICSFNRKGYLFTDKKKSKKN